MNVDKKALIWLTLLLLPTLAVCDENMFCEFNKTGNVTLFLSNNTQYIESADCNIHILSPSTEWITENENMNEISKGIYYYELQEKETNVTGKYTIVYNCSVSSNNYQSAGDYEIIQDLHTDSLDNINSTITELNVTISDEYFPTWNNTFMYWNNTLYPQWNSWLNETWYNIITPASDLILNMFDYFDGKLTTTINQDDVENIAQTTWNDTVVPDRSASEERRPTWQGPGQGWG